MHVLILGAMSGVFWTMATPVTAEVVGLQDLASALSLLWLLGTVIPTTCTPLIPFIQTFFRVIFHILILSSNSR